MENFRTFFYDNGGRFVVGGEQFGTLIINKKIFDGEFKDRKLHGWGCERSLNPANNLLFNDFIGCYRNGKRHGEGQKFYENGIYEGTWKNNKRSGLGIMWYNKGENQLYFGEWGKDLFNGAGVLVKAGGNRFEGFFVNGKKHGEGTFYHGETGQVQKGIWTEDICKCSLMQDDETRSRALRPTYFPIPELKISNPSFIFADEVQNIVESKFRSEGTSKKDFGK